MEHHHCSESFEVVDWVGGTIVTFKLRKFDVRQDGLLHNLSEEWGVGANIVMASGGNMAVFLDPLVHFLKLLIESIISIMDLEAWLVGGGSDFLRIES